MEQQRPCTSPAHSATRQKKSPPTRKQFLKVWRTAARAGKSSQKKAQQFQISRVTAQASMKKSKPRAYEVRVPASSANLGAGFDCFGLALNLYLTVRATVHSEPGARSEAQSRGIPGSEALPSAPEENLILRAMQHAAERHGLRLPAVHLAVKNQIPIAGGLGSSAAAIVAGTALGFAVCGKKLMEDNALR